MNLSEQQNTMPAPVTCPICEAPLAEAVAGQCPRCLLHLATTPDDHRADSASESGGRQFGDYVLGRQVGAGGMGVVYEAHRLSDGRKVALKLIREFHLASPKQSRRFMIEAEAIARLDHPDIVRVHEVGECDGQPFLCLDFIDGGSLAAVVDRIARRDGAPRPTPSELAGLLARVARAVHHAHTRGVLHRDLKPGNILLDSQGGPRLTDFGLAKILQPRAAESELPTLTSFGDQPGTPNYMAPEQITGGEAGCAADIYGLGAVLYALLTGRPPFQAATPLEVFQQIARQAPARPRVLNPSVPADLEIICLKCLEKSPRQRYATAEALAEDLERFAAGRPIVARPVGTVRRTGRWIARNPIGAALIASLCLGLIAALALLKVVNDQRREVELDRDEAFDEGMQKVSLIWQDAATKAVTVSARELAILAGRSPAGLARPRFQFTLAVNASDHPSSVAQRHAHLLGGLQTRMEQSLGGTVAFHLRLMKRFHPGDGTLARGEADFVVVSAVDFLRAERGTPGIVSIARTSGLREAVIFARTNSGIERIDQLRGRSIAFPDPGLSLTALAKARLLAAGLQARDFRSCTHFADRGADSGPGVISLSETLDRVIRGEMDAGVTRRAQFERCRHLGLAKLDAFPETPNVLAARAGLDPAVVNALREAVRFHEKSDAWPEGRFAVDAPAETDSLKPLLESLRDALRKADEFDGRVGP